LKSSIAKTVLILVSLIAAFAIAVNLSGTLYSDENEYFYVIIDYYSNWNATVTYSEEIFLKGMGKKEHLFVWPQESEANVTMTITAYKLDDSFNSLTIRVKNLDGVSLGQASTSTPNGFVTLTVRLN
jgi:uncharacterized membrane protein